MKIAQRITSWSFSRWSDYDQCPRKAKLKHIDKIKEPPNKAMERGSTIDKLAEEFLTGKLKKLPEELKLLKKEYTDMKKLKPKCQSLWALDKNWRPTDWFDWKNAWVRIKTDAEARLKDDPTTLLIDDTKTGKPRGGYGNQLSLYALGGFLMYPTVKKIMTRLLFTDHGPDATVSGEYARSDVEVLQRDWEERTKAMLSDTRFAPKPGYYCKWCFDSRANGGKCKF